VHSEQHLYTYDYDGWVPVHMRLTPPYPWCAA
jgi:hypothetical protein